MAADPNWGGAGGGSGTILNRCKRALQARIDRLSRECPEVDATSFFVTDAEGWQLARWPYDEKTVGENFAFRDYFHGQGLDYEASPEAAEPIRDVHRSIVFTSQATRKRMVAFSVPVWSDNPRSEQSDVLGVLAMTVELGHFSELRPEHGASSDHVTILVDTTTDANGREGSVLEHPALVAALRVPGATDRPFDFYIEENELARLESLRELVRAIRELRRQDSAVNDQQMALARLSSQARPLSKIEAFVDPVESPPTSGWLAAIEPVFVDERSAKAQDTGWAVIVQERRSAATLPVREMGRELVRVGLTGLAVVLGVITTLWGFVIIVLNESPRGRWFRWIRLRMGTATEGRLSDAASTGAHGGLETHDPTDAHLDDAVESLDDTP